MKGLDQKLSQTPSGAPDALPKSASARLRVVVFGAHGRMGIKLIEALRDDPESTLEAAIGRHESLPARGDVIVDFSSPEGSKRALEAAKAISVPLLVGTTGLSEAFVGQLRQASVSIPVMLASNTSLGVAVMHRMVDTAVRGLGGAWRVRLEETHHTRKLDAPSGTALALADTVRQAGGVLPRERIASIRQGEVVGRHRIEFEGPDERLVLEHEALDRALFARGALVLARWLRTQPAGMHSVQAWLQSRLDAGGKA